MLTFTPRTKRVIALAQEEAKKLNHAYVGTGHLLLGLLAEGAGVAVLVLKDFNLDLTAMRQEILKELTPEIHPSEDGQRGKGSP